MSVTNFKELIDKVVDTTDKIWEQIIDPEWEGTSYPADVAIKEAENAQQKAIDTLIAAINKLNDAHVTVIDFMA